MKKNIKLSRRNAITDRFFRFYHAIQKENAQVDSVNKKNDPESKKKKHYALGKKYPNVYLSFREAQCVALFLDGCTNEEAAKKLGLSRRTIEFYLNNIKMKLGEKNKNKIMEKIRSSYFLKSVEEVLKTIP